LGTAGHGREGPLHRLRAVDRRCVEDGIGGARDDLGPAPSVDIANGAPTGADATNQIVNAWADGRDGLNSEDVMFATSTDGGARRMQLSRDAAKCCAQHGERRSPATVER
jgi:hypothetical protein